MTLDPQLVYGHAVRRGNVLVVADTDEVIAIVEEAIAWRISENAHVCPECIDAYSRMKGGIRIPDGHAYDWALNRSPSLTARSDKA